MKKIIHIIAAFLAVSSVFLMAAGIFYAGGIPAGFQLVEGESLVLENSRLLHASVVQADASGITSAPSGVREYEADVKLFGVIPIKKVKVQVVDSMYVVPSGAPFGIKIFTEGVMVVGMTEVDGADGLVNPAEEAGIKIGDVIKTINGQPVSSNQDVAEIIEQSDGNALKLTIERQGKTMTKTFKAILSSMEQKYKAGIWVRDSSAGIGTMTFYSTVNGAFGGLGHAICDVDTGLVLPLSSGEIVGAKVYAVNPSVSGKAGELCGTFTDQRLGSLFSNCNIGIYGTLDTVQSSQELVRVAMRQEIKTGKAIIMTTVDETGPKAYECEIEKVYYKDTGETQNMVVRMTDPALLEKTGGIVQGMSGSPILQDGKLIGALTHVFVNEPQKGYAVFAEQMYDYAMDLAGEQKKAS